MRHSNIELLRIVAVLFILTLHTRFEGILAVYEGGIDINHICRFIFQAMSIVGVNLFVLISGYFGIKLKPSSLINILLQVVYITIVSILFTLIYSLVFDKPFHFNEIWFTPVAKIVWFVPAYIMLMIFTPILNVFIENTTTKKLAIYTACLYLLSIYWNSILVGTISGFDGYSWGWFIILYFTGCVIRRLEVSKSTVGGGFHKYPLLLYGIFTVLIVIVAIVQTRIPLGRSLLWTYNNPLVFISSICLFLYFCKLNIRNNILINWLARSAFAVILFHMTFFSLYQDICSIIYENFNGVACIFVTFSFIITVYMIATIIDQPRIYIYKCIKRKYNL